jgi:hypothetical protein
MRRRVGFTSFCGSCTRVEAGKGMRKYTLDLSDAHTYTQVQSRDRETRASSVQQVPMNKIWRDCDERLKQEEFGDSNYA